MYPLFIFLLKLEAFPVVLHVLCRAAFTLWAEFAEDSSLPPGSWLWSYSWRGSCRPVVLTVAKTGTPPSSPSSSSGLLVNWNQCKLSEKNLPSFLKLRENQNLLFDLLFYSVSRVRPRESAKTPGGHFFPYLSGFPGAVAPSAQEPGCLPPPSPPH